MTFRGRLKKVIQYGGHRYERKDLMNLKECLSFVNGRPVAKEGDLFSFSEFEIRDRVTSGEYAEFENGDMLLVTVIDEGAYSENTPGSPAYVSMYALIRLADD
jgi:hypothetical protein